MPRLSTEQRFWAKVDQNGPVILAEPCWNWVGSKNRNGYGTFPIGNRNLLAHRFVYEALVDLIPPRLVIDHLCRNHACVNIKHLEPKTNRENTFAPGSQASCVALLARTHCNHGHPFDEANTMLTRGGWRACRACHRQHDANYRASGRKRKRSTWPAKGTKRWLLLHPPVTSSP